MFRGLWNIQLMTDVIPSIKVDYRATVSQRRMIQQAFPQLWWQLVYSPRDRSREAKQSRLTRGFPLEKVSVE